MVVPLLVFLNYLSPQELPLVFSFVIKRIIVCWITSLFVFKI